MKKTSQTVLHFAFFILIILQLLSCKKDDEKQETKALQGTIQAWDDKLAYNLDPSGIEVTVLNNASLRTTTDANGKFYFANLPYDNYDFVISKSGFGEKKIFGITHSSKSQDPTSIPLIGFGKSSTTTVSGLSINGTSFQGEPGVSFNLTVAPAPSTANKAFIRYFFSTANDVSNHKYTAVSELKAYSNNNGFSGFTSSDLIALGLKSGQLVYAKAYGESFQSNDYFDPSLGRRVFPNINSTSAAAVSFIVP